MDGVRHTQWLAATVNESVRLCVLVAQRSIRFQQRPINPTSSTGLVIWQTTYTDNQMTEMVPCLLNGKWDLTLPDHRPPQWVDGWEVERLDAMHAVIRPGDTVIDVGTEEGDMSALCAQWAGPDGNMILVEPNPKVWPTFGPYGTTTKSWRRC